MISSAAEYYKLWESEQKTEVDRIIYEDATLDVWLEIISRFPECHVTVAQNKVVPIAVLALLARSGSEEVRFWVAMKRKLTRELLEKLSEDGSPAVRHRVASNRSTPVELLERLVSDIDPVVSKGAAERMRKLKASATREQVNACESGEHKSRLSS